MSNSISIKKLKRVMYASLRWRLQVPTYYPLNKIPKKDTMSQFSQGVLTAYQDLLREIEKIETSENQRQVYGKVYFTDDAVDEYKWENNP